MKEAVMTAVVRNIGAMSEADYRKEREAIRVTYGDGSRPQAHAHADQALAALFVRSGWTQEQLAMVEGESRPYVARRLLFGHFLADVPIGTSAEFDAIRLALTEGKFRQHWARTDAKDNTRQRFLQARRSIIEEEQLSLQRSRTRKHPQIPAAIKELADGKWHHESTILAHTHKACLANEPPVTVRDEDILAVLAGMFMHKTHGVSCEKRKGAKGWMYKLARVGRSIDYDVFMQEVGPILDSLRAEGKKNMATMSPGTVARLAYELQCLIERLADVTDQPRKRVVPAPQETDDE